MEDEKTELSRVSKDFTKLTLDPRVDLDDLGKAKQEIKYLNNYVITLSDKINCLKDDISELKNKLLQCEKERKAYRSAMVRWYSKYMELKVKGEK